MAVHQDVAPGGEVALGLAVHLGNQRAGGVEIQQPPPPRLVGHRFGHAMRREHHVPVIRHGVQLVDEHRPLGFQLLHHGAVVHDFMADIDRRAVAAQGFLHHADGAVHAGAEAARRGQQDAEGWPGGKIVGHVVHGAGWPHYGGVRVVGQLPGPHFGVADAF